jgi:hypothetical protein
MPVPRFEEFNETDVREEIIASLLRALGYCSGTDNNIIRELGRRAVWTVRSLRVVATADRRPGSLAVQTRRECRLAFCGRQGGEREWTTG